MIREPRIEDAESLHETHAAAWRAAYTGLIPPAVIDRVTDPAGIERVRDAMQRPPGDRSTLVWDEPGVGVVGFAGFGPERTGDRDWPGEVYAIYVHPDWQGGGRGRALLVAAAQRLATPFLLWVLRENAPARAFYERLGGVALGREKADERFGGVVEVAYGWPSPPR